MSIGDLVAELLMSIGDLVAELLMSIGDLVAELLMSIGDLVAELLMSIGDFVADCDLVAELLMSIGDEVADHHLTQQQTVLKEKCAQGSDAMAMEQALKEVREGSLEGACTLIAGMLAEGKPAHFMDLLAAMMADCAASPAHARYFATRIKMLAFSRVRRDPRALTRLALETAAVAYWWHHQPEGGRGACASGWPEQQVSGGALQEVGGMLTTEASALVGRLPLQGRRDTVRGALVALCNIKTYDLCLPVDGVSQAASKDPLWIAWSLLTDHVQWKTKPARQYALDLLCMYKFRFKRGQRKQRLMLLEHAWMGAFWGAPLVLAPGPVLPPVAAEVALKGCYLYNEQKERIRREGAQGGRAPQAEDAAELDPALFKVTPYEHQKREWHAMATLEASKRTHDSFVRMANGQLLQTSAAFLCDPPGSGKSYTMLGYILAHEIPDDTPSVDRAFMRGDLRLVTFCSQESVVQVKTNLIVVMRGTIKQWQKYVDDMFNMPEGKSSFVKSCAKGTAMDDLFRGKYDIFITDQTGLKNIYNDTRFGCTKFARFILDEADSITVPAVEMPMARFKWFITATPMSLVTGNRAAMVDVRRYCSTLTYDVLKMVRVSSTPEFVDASLNMPPMTERTVRVRRTQLSRMLQQYVPDSVRRAMDASDYTSAINMLGCEHVSGGQETLVAAVLQRFERELRSIEASYATAPASVLPTLQARIVAAQDKIKSVQDRIRGTDCCPIGFTEFTEESVRAVVPCCQNVFLLENLVEWLRTHPRCPLCRTSLQSSQLLVQHPKGSGEDSSDGEEGPPCLDDSVPTIPQPDRVCYPAAVDALKGVVDFVRRSNPAARILVFSEYNMEGFNTALAGLRYRALGGSSGSMANTIKDYNAGTVQVLLLNVRHFGAGINLELTDHIVVLHELETDRYTQLLNIAHLYHNIADRQRRKRETYRKVLGRCEHFVRAAAAGESFRCLFQVPLYVPGLPLYDLGDCTKYIKGQLQEAGFVVKHYLPNLLMISWDLADLEAEQAVGETGGALGARATTGLLGPAGASNRPALKAAGPGVMTKSVRFLADGCVQQGCARKFSINLGALLDNAILDYSQFFPFEDARPAMPAPAPAQRQVIELLMYVLSGLLLLVALDIILRLGFRAGALAGVGAGAGMAGFPVPQLRLLT
ncbi:hypothetical protein HXX76_014051 [Chlamydomonas incerta]|uniref:Helicase ATP-binding domain-containing protein n=1 Tax=Chlamydomonas incerta TaxID=51695 RepID=A0A835SK09_CHLIN|nr:hypothetical protein HXX76_014051 [Chlamydomonas incerta]|eukprot:KAG2424893.1 hypothetical protein HXX76_014051 [Chlamydomonas incerta]